MLTVILAAGKGTRMKSDLPKVLHEVAGKPMLKYSIELAESISSSVPSSRVAIVVGYGADDVKKMMGDKYTYCTQKEQNGTADAVLAAKDIIGSVDDDVLILCGDMPNLKKETVEKFISNCKKDMPNFISVKSAKPKGYGRVIRSSDKSILKIVEEKDANDSEKKVNEINSGVYLCNSKLLLERLAKVGNSNAQGEYYLTDIMKDGANGWLATDEKEFLGANDRQQLAELSKLIWKERAIKHMLDGVSIIDPDHTYIDSHVAIASDTTIYPNVFLQGKTAIGKGTTILSGTRVVDSIVGENNIIKDNCLIEESKIGNDCKIGPMAHLRPGSLLHGHNHVGNYVELKKAELGEGTKANHLTYLGDCTLGKNCNVGCGTITCNYDGFNKYRTTIGDNVFVGSDVQFVAPITVGDGVIVGAGSTITEDIPANAIALARTVQKNLEGKAETFRKLKGNKK